MAWLPNIRFDATHERDRRTDRQTHTSHRHRVMAYTALMYSIAQ